MTESGDSNNNLLWEKLLLVLDDKLQFGLLERLRRASEFRFEGGTLIIAPGSKEDFSYLSKDTVHQQLSLFAEQATRVTKVLIKDVD